MLRWSTRDNQESYWDCRGSDGKVSVREEEAKWCDVRNKADSSTEVQWDSEKVEEGEDQE